jgi:hypothetical protein
MDQAAGMIRCEEDGVFWTPPGVCPLCVANAEIARLIEENEALIEERAAWLKQKEEKKDVKAKVNAPAKKVKKGKTKGK